MSRTSLRRATERDAATLGRLHSLCWRATYQGIATDAFLESFSPLKRTAYFERILPGSTSEHYLLCYDEMPVGLLAFGPAQEERFDRLGDGELHALYILPEYQGRGIGSVAMRFALDRFRAMQVTGVILYVICENTRAASIYEHYGFMPDGEPEPFFMGRKVMERRYRKLLSPA